jgi:uncharacterized protein YbbC (DUF1343 family)
MRSLPLIVCIYLILQDCSSQPVSNPVPVRQDGLTCVITTGAERTGIYFPWLAGKRIAVVANQTSLIGHTHLVDSLVHAGFNVAKIFSPEHGFRGTEDAGQAIGDMTDKTTGIPIVSLYGDHDNPSEKDLKGVDAVLFDIQDVGVRFFTYISTLTYVMEACAQKGIPFIVLDRPDPNGDYVDGPVLKKDYASFVGLHPVPVVYGMTIGEYALMVNGEGWLKDGIKADLRVVPLKGYDHSCRCDLPVKPSPNLPNANAIRLYPSLALFEGTVVSVGRGTDSPFEVFGHPNYMIGSYVFKPHSMPGAMHPPYEGVECYGFNVSGAGENAGQGHLILSWLINAYRFLHNSSSFFNAYFDKLAGSDELRQQIIAGKSEEEIRASWKRDLEAFKEIRKKYLLYPDFK